MRYTLSKKFLLLFADTKVSIQSYCLGLNITPSPSHYFAFALIIIFTSLSGCTTTDFRSSSLSIQQKNQILEEKLGAYIAREEALAAQEAEVSAREKKLIDLYAELVKEKKSTSSE